MVVTEAQREEFEERAAIMEFDGKMSRAQAEVSARRLLASKWETGNTSTSITENHGAVR